MMQRQLEQQQQEMEKLRELPLTVETVEASAMTQSQGESATKALAALQPPRPPPSAATSSSGGSSAAPPGSAEVPTPESLPAPTVFSFVTPRSVATVASESGQATSTVAEFVNEFDATALTSPPEIDAASASNTSGSGLLGFEMVPPEDSQ